MITGALYLKDKPQLRMDGAGVAIIFIEKLI
jgi:hypothetical protein